MKIVQVDPVVEQEINAAIDYLNTDPPGRGDELFQFVHEAFEFIALFPQAGGQFGTTRFRKHILKKYKYVIVYEELDDRIRVLALAHPRRRAGYWMDRI